jgi:cytochrome c oxidase subunit 2
MSLSALIITVAAEAAAARVIEITAARFRFEPASIEVSEGESVSLRLRSADGTHGIEIKGYGLKLKIPKGGAEVRLDFVADKPGRFDFVCSEYCGSGHRGMRGKLVVTQRAR